MYRSDLVAERIKYIAKIRKVSKIKEMLEKCGLSKNAISTMRSGGSMPKSENLAKIADYLDCSVDYLLGRTDIPDMVVENKNVINGVTVASPVQVIGAEKPLDELTAEFVKQFKGLSYQDKLDIMQAVAEKYEVKKD